MSPSQAVATASELYEAWRRTTAANAQAAAQRGFEEALAAAVCVTKVCPNKLRAEIIKRSPLYAALRNSGKSMFDAYMVAARTKLLEPLFLAPNSDPAAAQ